MNLEEGGHLRKELSISNPNEVVVVEARMDRNSKDRVVSTVVIALSEKQKPLRDYLQRGGDLHLFQASDIGSYTILAVVNEYNFIPRTNSDVAHLSLICANISAYVSNFENISTCLRKKISCFPLESNETKLDNLHILEQDTTTNHFSFSTSMSNPSYL